MILTMLGALIIIIVVMIEKATVFNIAVGAVLVIIGLLSMGVADEECRARTNRRKYWANRK